MAARWPLRKIKTLGKVVTGKTPSTSDSANFGGTYPFITIPDLNGQVYIRSTQRTISKQGAELLRSCLLPANAVMMSCIATTGECGITAKPSFTNQQINSVISNDEVEPRYLYYCFTQLKSQLEATGGGGSVYTNVSKSRFSELEIPLPPLPVQKAIAHILGSLDDKIELNRKMNETLEAMALAIFKSWFVDFDPVRAKMEGRQPFGMDAKTAALFPNSFQDSPLGKIPKGWEIKSFSQAVDINPLRRIEKGTITAHVDMASLPIKGARINERTLREFRGGGSRFANGDILLARITPCLENGKTALVDFLDKGVIAWGSTEFIVLGPKEHLSTWFIYCLARFPDFRNHAIQSMSGTSGRQRVDNGCFDQYMMAIPTVEIVRQFDRQVERWFKLIKENDCQSRTLASIRGALLPKLISGQIRMKDAEKFVEKK